MSGHLRVIMMNGVLDEPIDLQEDDDDDDDDDGENLSYDNGYTRNLNEIEVGDNNDDNDDDGNNAI